MKFFRQTFFIFLVIGLFRMASAQQHIGYSSGFHNDKDSTKDYYYEAYKELERMLNGTDSLNYERAIFITENAYWENKYSYDDFEKLINWHLNKIKLVRTKLRMDNILKYKELKRFEQKMFLQNTSNAAIYTYLTDTTSYVYEKEKLILEHEPFLYSKEDPYGTVNWKNSQVLNLLNPDVREGNCYAWVALFKIFSERLQSEAYISTAPHHIYIQHRNIKGDFCNVELPSRSFPGDGTIQTLTYTTREGIINNISMRRLCLEQSIALCLIYLARSYEYKYNSMDTDFTLKCCNLVLQYDSLNLNAMLFKATIMEESIINFMNRSGITNVASLRDNQNMQWLFNTYEEHVMRLYRLGYREIPRDVEQILLSRMKGDTLGKYKDRTPNAFPNLNVNDMRFVTLSNGMFDEVHLNEQYCKLGRTLLDVENGIILGFDNDSATGYKVDPVVFAMSIDPLTAKYPHMSPYSAFGDNPIYFVDYTGEENIVYIYVSPTAKNSPEFKTINWDDIRKKVQEYYANVVGITNVEIKFVDTPPEPYELDPSDIFVYVAGGKSSSEAANELNEFNDKYPIENTSGKGFYFGHDHSFDGDWTGYPSGKSTTYGLDGRFEEYHEGRNMAGIYLPEVKADAVLLHTTLSELLAFTIFHETGHGVTTLVHNAYNISKTEKTFMADGGEAFENRNNSNSILKKAYEDHYKNNKPSDNRALNKFNKQRRWGGNPKF